jgi:hypothetical protein
MIDAEVLRLRRLRDIALRTRALGDFLDSDSESSEEQSLFANCALTCWTIARIATGRLRAHPYLSYQQGPGRLRAVTDRALAALMGMSARRATRTFSVCGEELDAVAREVDDVRALTWSPELSDALGRMQTQIRRLAHEFEQRAQLETGETAQPRAVVRTDTRTSLDELAVENSWPYLAI